MGLAGRDIHHRIELVEGCRVVCLVSLCGSCGGRGGWFCSWVDFEIENAGVHTEIEADNFQVAGLFDRIFHFSLNINKSTTV